MKSTVYVEYNGNKVSDKELIDKAKEVWRANGKMVKDIKTVELYFKPEESKCYYVINETETGDFSI